MSRALYRRYRPETFADVIGQEHVTEPLMQALRTGRVNHAYLFSGPRGCGKTTSARILARCLNCEQGPTPEPCGVCESCVSLARGGPGTVDVIEIDAASHGGVDDARDLRERASFGPAQSRFKVYIIDEAHMVSTQGFNALLKIVEEPPEHVKFIFATTEPDKVIGTIRSRTHHYPFHLVPPRQLEEYLSTLAASEGVEIEPGVLSFVVRAGGGSVRDSLSVLDQLIAGSGAEGLTYAGAAALLGFTDAELLDGVADALAAGDAPSLFQQVDKVIESGHDPRRFVEDLLQRLRDLILIAAVGEGAAQLLRGVPADEFARMRAQADAYGAAALSRAADIVNDGLTAMTGATPPRTHLELICARLMLPGADGEQGYGARLDRLERRLALGSPAPVPASAPQPVPNRAPEPPPPAGPRPEEARPEVARPATPAPVESRPVESSTVEPRTEEARPATPAPVEPPPVPSAQSSAEAPQVAPNGVDVAAVRRAWPEVLEGIASIRRVTWTLVAKNAQVADYDGVTLTLVVDSPGLAEKFTSGNHLTVVRQAVSERLGLDLEVSVRVGGETPAAASMPPAAPEPPPSPSRRHERRAAPPVDSSASATAAEDDFSADDQTLQQAHPAGPQVVIDMLGGRVIEDNAE